MNAIYIAVFSVTAIGIFCAAVLSVASKFMNVKNDERVAEIEECLPGLNCGACGYPGCAGYAAALLSGGKTNLCSPGGGEVIKKISAILGVEAASVERKIAVVHCLGSDKTQRKKMDYSGIRTCEAAKQLFGGEGACAFGCLGYGDCLKVCPNKAICLEDSLAHIRPDLCMGCGLCVMTCPNKLITVESAKIPVSVLCSNVEKGAVTRKKCSSGCIGDGKCARICLSGAILIENNLAKIDYSKCVGCTRCSDICTIHCIKPNAGGGRQGAAGGA